MATQALSAGSPPSLSTRVIHRGSLVASSGGANTYHYRASDGSHGDTTNAAAVPASAVIRRIASS